jgi:hypothetical protein
MTRGTDQRPTQPAPPSDAARRAAVIETLIPAAPSDITPLRIAFSRMVSKQWEAHVPITHAQSAKARFIAEMYARACYSMLLVSGEGPTALRLWVRAAAMLPLPRGLAIRLGSALLAGLDWLVPRTVHRQLLLTSALMGTLDVVLDEAASCGEAAVLRIASLVTRNAPASLPPSEQRIATLAQTIRRYEDAWQSGFWETVLQPAVRDYCLAEARAVAQVPDPTGMGHRWAGIDAAIKGMWYVVGPSMGLRGSLSRFERSEWNREQQWMADTSLLMQMIDDWVDQDEDRGTRVTPVVAGDWSTQSVIDLHNKTVRDLSFMLSENGIRNVVIQQLFVDLYNDYLHAALDGMRSGVAA